MIGYKTKFRRNSTKLIQHLSLIIYFERETGRSNPYEIHYEIEDQNGMVYKGSDKYAGAKPCKIGYTGVPEILECPKPAFEEIVLKSQQQVKPAVTRGLVQNGSWWITKGFEYPSFETSKYKIKKLQILERKSKKILWTIP